MSFSMVDREVFEDRECRVSGDVVLQTVKLLIFPGDLARARTWQQSTKVERALSIPHYMSIS